MSFVQVTEINWGLSSVPKFTPVMIRPEDVYLVSQHGRDRKEVALVFGVNDEAFNRVIIQGELHDVATAIGGLFRAELWRSSHGAPKLHVYLRESAIKAAFPLEPSYVRVVLRSGMMLVLEAADVPWFEDLSKAKCTAPKLLPSVDA